MSKCFFATKTTYQDLIGFGLRKSFVQKNLFNFTLSSRYTSFMQYSMLLYTVKNGFFLYVQIFTLCVFKPKCYNIVNAPHGERTVCRRMVSAASASWPHSLPLFPPPLSQTQSGRVLREVHTHIDFPPTHLACWWGQMAGLGIHSFQKNGTIFALFSVLYKRTERSLRSFPFFIKKRNVFCVLLRYLW